MVGQVGGSETPYEVESWKKKKNVCITDAWLPIKTVQDPHRLQKDTLN